MVNYNSPRQYLNINRTDFDILVRHHVTIKLKVFRVPPLANNFEVSTGSPVRGLVVQVLRVKTKLSMFYVES